MILKRQELFSKNNCEKIFLSPYAQIFSNKDDIIFYRKDMNIYLQLSFEIKFSEMMIDLLKCGIYYHEFIDKLEQEGVIGADVFVSKMISEGILE